MKYTIGVDFGTESGRAVLVEVATGREVATAVYSYSHGVIDEKLPLPSEEIRLEPDWALQDPEDYIRTFQNTIPAVLRDSGVSPKDVIGLGIDFTACTMMPVKADGTPLCVLPESRARPHAWVKLWKHHAAQPQADRINALARERGWVPTSLRACSTWRTVRRCPSSGSGSRCAGSWHRHTASPSGR